MTTLTVIFLGHFYNHCYNRTSCHCILGPALHSEIPLVSQRPFVHSISNLGYPSPSPRKITFISQYKINNVPYLSAEVIWVVASQEGRAGWGTHGLDVALL